MKETCIVSNKSAGRVVYNIKEDGIRREFFPNETRKDIRVSELEKLIQQPGGRELLYNYLWVQDREVLEYLINGEIAPEYWIKPEDLPTWMQECSLPEFQDALDFAPDGMKDLIKQYAVSLPLNDYSKRQAIKDQLGFDVSVVITNSEDETKTATKPAGRRVQAVVAETAVEEDEPKRRVVVE